MVHENTFYGFLAQSRKCLTSWADHIAAEWVIENEQTQRSISKSQLYANAVILYSISLLVWQIQAKTDTSNDFLCIIYPTKMCVLYMWRTDCLNWTNGREEIEAKSREEVSNPTSPRHSWEPNCECMCLWLYTHVLTSVFVCLSEFTPALWYTGLCLCVSWEESERGREWMWWVVFVSVWPVCRFDGGVEPPRANGNAAAAILRNSQGGLRRRMKEEVNNNTIKYYRDVFTSS